MLKKGEYRAARYSHGLRYAKARNDIRIEFYLIGDKEVERQSVLAFIQAQRITFFSSRRPKEALTSLYAIAYYAYYQERT